jgi:hypothetical protein
LKKNEKRILTFAMIMIGFLGVALFGQIYRGYLKKNTIVLTADNLIKKTLKDYHLIDSVEYKKLLKNDFITCGKSFRDSNNCIRYFLFKNNISLGSLSTNIGQWLLILLFMIITIFVIRNGEKLHPPNKIGNSKPCSSKGMRVHRKPRNL